ncbi:MAG: hypothetical protein J7L23_02610 [Candidatus Diapherotrites archaeon]|nr:hypothetical protein [Candidatus Diapherotrites archaeon]
MPEKLFEKRREFAKALVEHGMHKTAAQYEAIRRIKYERKELETLVPFTLERFREPILPEIFKYHRHLDPIFNDVRYLLEEAQKELEEKEGFHSHVARVLLQEVRDEMIHHQDFDPDRRPERMRVSYIVGRVKRLMKSKEKERKAIFGQQEKTN